MQSILQYRRFGKHVREQHEKHRRDLAASDSSPAEPESDSIPKSNRPTSNGDIPDLEKGEIYPEDPEPAGEPLTAPEKPESVHDAQDINRATTVPTHRSMGTKLGHSMTGIEVRRRTTREGPSDGGDKEVFVVGFEGEDDPLKPHNWSKATKFGATYDQCHEYSRYRAY